MIDRFVTAAGGLADAADRAMRSVLRGPRFATRPVSAIVAVGLLVVAVLAVLASLETPSDPGPRMMTAADVAELQGSSGRFGAQVSGGIAAQYAEYFQDLNLDGAWEEGEPTIEWDYFLIDPDSMTGVTVRSQRPVEDVFTLATNGYVVEDRAAIAASVDWFWQEVEVGGLELDRTRYIDATLSGAGVKHDLATDDLPRAGTPIAVEGSRSPTYVPVCGPDPASIGMCDDADATAFDVVAYDPQSRKAVMVRLPESPAFAPAAIGGVLRRDAGGIAGALEATGWSPSELGFSVSPSLILVEGASAPSGLPLLLVAAGALLVAATIILGAASGYVRFRADPGPAGTWTSSAQPPADHPGLPIAVHVTGRLHARCGDAQVREAAGDLARFATHHAPDAPTTLIVERPAERQGIAVGRGDLDAQPETGTVRSLRWERPAIRLATRTGPVILTFDDVPGRDAATHALTSEQEEPWTPGN